MCATELFKATHSFSRNAGVMIKRRVGPERGSFFFLWPGRVKLFVEAQTKSCVIRPPPPPPARACDSCCVLVLLCPFSFSFFSRLIVGTLTLAARARPRWPGVGGPAPAHPGVPQRREKLRRQGRSALSAQLLNGSLVLVPCFVFAWLGVRPIPPSVALASPPCGAGVACVCVCVVVVRHSVLVVDALTQR